MNQHAYSYFKLKAMSLFLKEILLHALKKPKGLKLLWTNWIYHHYSITSTDLKKKLIFFECFILRSEK